MQSSVITAPAWIQAVRPVIPPALQPIVPGSSTVCWYCEVQFERYSLPLGASKMPWKETYGKTQIVGDDGRWSVAEIELVRRLWAAGWSAGWIDAFGSAPSAWASWLVHPGELESPLRQEFNAITNDTGFQGGGKPDVIAWRGNTLANAVFIEYKGPTDRIRPGQDAWLTSALNHGMACDNFLVVKWPKKASR